MDGAPEIYNGSRDVTTSLSGTVCSPYAGTDLYTKFEIGPYRIHTTTAYTALSIASCGKNHARVIFHLARSVVCVSECWSRG